MNHLAHMLLSCDSDTLMVGNFVADFILPKEARLLPEAIQNGIDLHKSIDQYTDSHQGVKKINSIFAKTQKKYAPVVTDICLDHFLIRNWSVFASSQVNHFAEDCYKLLSKNQTYFPTHLREIFPKMIQDNFLTSCENEHRLRRTFARVKLRTTFENNFDIAVDEMLLHYNEINDIFLEFFPMLQKHTQDLCNC